MPLSLDREKLCRRQQKRKQFVLKDVVIIARHGAKNPHTPSHSQPRFFTTIGC